MQTLRKKTSPCKYRNDPAKFFGDGVTFKAKLIGILEVGEARGDRMCQEALQDLKMAIRAAGEHKQRITIHVTIDGLRLRDEKTGDSLYHHPVHKISFIAQDMTDSRAFGYIFGSPDSGHRFFGIKTDKAASQVVLAMRDLFQVVFELKKKEIELARQHIQSKSIHEHTPVTFNVKNSNSDTTGGSSNNKSGTATELGAAKSSCIKQISPESVADLVDLEQELSSIQRGITQMERITPNEPPTKTTTETEDPFGDSFTNFPAYNIPPPPESSKSRHSKPLKPPEETIPISSIEPTPSLIQQVQNIPSSDDWLHVTTTTTSQSALTFDEVTALADQNDAENNIRRHEPDSNGGNSNTANVASTLKFVDAFTDLDPLGTGKNRPYVDKKYFFHDLKNPPKKVLKDLSGKDSSFTANFSTSPSSSGVLNISDDSSTSKSSDKLCDIDLKIFESSLAATQESQCENNVKIAEEPIKLIADPVKSLPIDPFLDDDDFSKITIDPFEFGFNQKRSVLSETKINSTDESTGKDDKSVFNGPLQVNLPPENWTSQMNQKKLERQNSETNSPTFQTAASSMSASRNRPSVFKQNTVDVISSISSKKMKPHLFGQKFSKRDSNSINMRRLQESDSLSENETAPEPPPRPDSGSHIEPPPLPPKKQFSDIIIRPSPRGNNINSATRDSSVRYDFLSSSIKTSKSQSDNAPPLPLPSRKIGKSEISYPGPGRPSKRLTEDEDYLTPLENSVTTNLPILLPPPQQKQGSKTRQNRKLESSDSIKSTDTISLEQKPITISETSIPDITLSQLLTLGIDDLAKKLNVPTSKLNTMTLVELTTYLSDFIENTKKKPPPAPVEIPKESPVFKVNFSQANDSMFVAKFDDNFGEDSTFVANFDNFDMKVESEAGGSNGATDRYAVFREIIDQENCNSESEIFETPLSSLTMIDDKELPNDETPEKSEEIPPLFIPSVLPKIDTKITEAISHAKDRYAALRDIILVEDLFDKNPSSILQVVPRQALTPSQEIKDDIIKISEDNEDSKSTSPIEICESTRNSPEINIFPDDSDQNSDPVNNLAPKDTSKDDLEIDEYMQRAISNLSLDSRDHLSPISTSKSPIITTNHQSSLQNASTSPIRTPAPIDVPSGPEIVTKSPRDEKITVIDMSTSPIPIQKSPIPLSPASKSPVPPAAGPVRMVKLHVTEVPHEIRVSPETIKKSVKLASEQPVGDLNNESWAVFDKQTIAPVIASSITIKTKSPNKDDGESPCSSDGKDEWKSAQDYSRRWPNGQTSSSSRDVSPWDEDGPEYRRRYHPPDKLGHHARHTARRLNSCDEDYDFDDKLARRKDRRIKGPGMNRSRENFESENWYHLNDQNNWSPPEDDDRPFDRSSYERSTYGPPYDKRDHKNIPYDHKGYDKRDHKGYDKRKYHREYSRPEYEMDRRGNYFEDDYDRRARPPPRKDYTDELFDGSFDRESRDSHSSRKSNRDYFYERDKRSFDRESIESYESGRGGGRRSFGSGEIYGSLDSRGEFRDRDRHLTADKSRSWRKGMRSTCPDEDYDQDSESDATRRVPGDTRSLQRPATSRPRMSSVSSPWDGEDLTPTSTQSKSWKRPASASESERRLAENKRILSNNTLSGSDGEKDRRFRKKSRQRNEKEPDNRMPNYASLRYPRRRGDDYFEFDDQQLPPAPPIPQKVGGGPIIDSYFPSGDEDKPRITDNSERQYYVKREQFFKNLTPRSESRTMSETLRHASYDKEFERRKHSPRENYGFRDRKFDESVKTPVSGGGGGPPSSAGSTCKHVRMEFEFDEFEDTPRSTTSSKFNFEEEQGFESDFNSPPASNNEFRFSNDFSEKDTSPRMPPPQPKNMQQKASNYLFDAEFPSSSSSVIGGGSGSGGGGGGGGGSGGNSIPPNTAKLRFDENVTVSQFNTDSISQTQMFEDDFAKAEFSFEDKDKWNELPTSVQSLGVGKIISKNTKGVGPGSKFDYIKKSESVNIFAKKVDDPFEDDDFFKSSGGNSNNNNHHHNNGGGGNGNNNNNNNEKNSKHDPFQWEKNFAKFDDI